MQIIKIIYPKRKLLYFLFVSHILLACNLEQDIDIELPQVPSQLFVECYLEEGRNMRLALSETQAALANPTLPIIADANVSITYNGIEHFLRFEPTADTLENMVYNYVSDNIVDDILQGGEYELKINDPQGRSVRGTTRFLETPQIESIEARFRESDSLAFVLVTFPDPNPETDNFFRIVINLDTLTGNREIDISLQDRFSTDGKITIGTPYNYKKGDTLLVSVYHIEEDYFDFIESVEEAANANGNPFAQPAIVKHTVEEGMGVFTTLAYDRRLFVVKEE